MRPPFKLGAVLLSSLIVTGFLLYSGKITLHGSTKTASNQEQMVRRYLDLDRKHADGGKLMAPESMDELKDPVAIYSAFLSILHEQAVMNTKDSLSRSDFDTVITLSLLLPPIRNISRILTPLPQTFRDYIGPAGLPVIFTDMLVGTNMDNWSWDYVQEKWGNEVFHNTRQGNYSTDVTHFGKHKINRVSVRLSDFIDVATGKRKPRDREKGLYITKQRMLPKDALEKEFYYPPFYDGLNRKCFLEPTGW